MRTSGGVLAVCLIVEAEGGTGEGEVTYGERPNGFVEFAKIHSCLPGHYLSPISLITHFHHARSEKVTSTSSQVNVHPAARPSVLSNNEGT